MDRPKIITDELSCCLVTGALKIFLHAPWCHVRTVMSCMLQDVERLPRDVKVVCPAVSVGYVSRGGPRSADHVDILGHVDVLRDVLTIASGHGDELQDKILSDVKRIADNIKLDVGCD